MFYNVNWHHVQDNSHLVVKNGVFFKDVEEIALMSDLSTQFGFNQYKLIEEALVINLVSRLCLFVIENVVFGLIGKVLKTVYFLHLIAKVDVYLCSFYLISLV